MAKDLAIVRICSVGTMSILFMIQYPDHKTYTHLVNVLMTSGGFVQEVSTEFSLHNILLLTSSNQFDQFQKSRTTKI